VPQQITWRSSCSLLAVEPLGQRALQRFESAAELWLLERARAGIVPRGEVESLTSAYSLLPMRAYKFGACYRTNSGPDEEHGRDALAQALAHRFVANVVFPFPVAVRAFDVAWREHGKEQMRLTQALLNRLPPGIHTGDTAHVEKDA
jgi:hypothetical protein